jgi:hypothetical protein
MKISIKIAFLLLTTTSSLAQSNRPKPAAPVPSIASQVPLAKPEDVKSVDAILHSIYDVISGPAGDRDWNRFRSLFAPQARLTSTTKESDAHPVRLLSADDYANLAGDYFKTHAFYESPIVNRVEEFGNIAQVFSSYESRNAPNERPFTRGINSIQLFTDGSRWYVLSILWDEETPTTPLPSNMATRSSAPVTQ